MRRICFVLGRRKEEARAKVRVEELGSQGGWGILDEDRSIERGWMCGL